MALKSINPATGETLATFDTLSPAAVEDKLQRAVAAFASWRQTAYADRARLLVRAADILENESEQLGRLMTLEMGKPLRPGIDEALKCARGCRYYAEHGATFLAEERVPTEARDSYIRYEPLGVVLAIMPWNFPFWQVFRFVAPALMAGNVGLLKHASNVPQCALAIEDILRRAGFPEGVFQTLLIRSSEVAATARRCAGERGDADRERRRRAGRGSARGSRAQEDRARARRQRPVHRHAQRRYRQGGGHGGEGASDQQRAIVHRGEAVHRRRRHCRSIPGEVRRGDGSNEGRESARRGN